MPIYARFGVVYGWLIDPLGHTLDAYALDAGVRREIGCSACSNRVSVAPFDAVAINLGDNGVVPSLHSLPSTPQRARRSTRFAAAFDGGAWSAIGRNRRRRNGSGEGRVRP